MKKSPVVKKLSDQPGFTCLGLKFPTAEEASNFAEMARSQLEDKHGPFTESEWLDQQRPHAFDTRDSNQRISDNYFQVIKRTKPLTPAEAHLRRMEDELEKDRYDRLTLAEKRVEDARRLVEKERGDTIAKQEADRHAKEVAPALAKLDQLEDAYRWSDKADNALRIAIDQARQQIADPDGCPIAAKRCLNRVDSWLEADRLEKLEAIMQQKEQLFHQEQAYRTEAQKISDLLGVRPLDEMRVQITEQIAQEFNNESE